MKVYHFERDLNVKLKERIREVTKGLENVVYVSSDGRTITVIANEEEENHDAD